ncbi:hypothetical protein F5Y19DRAFT_435048 [Xylariaceae sp. FL1651]|nr:hypothetical protein F5Y19DRAFT_435048 [Xylariaceae sp. FL1651]
MISLWIFSGVVVKLCVSYMVVARPLKTIAAYKGMGAMRFCVLLFLNSLTIAVTVLPISVASLAATLASFPFFTPFVFLLAIWWQCALYYLLFRVI